MYQNNFPIETWGDPRKLDQERANGKLPGHRMAQSRGLPRVYARRLQTLRGRVQIRPSLLKKHHRR